ncbi:SEFIR domain-containing protein [Amycolatopsis sp. CA-230715]|uniref:SEFIR domain-containing protein n=1 Tax=Amycolatopsis sp. CA-230715 TaxID=2745196 RepID=UPI001C02E815|nr:SEFIR domain-containing protein [Amycolatopsis sp. CA-230715]QWF83014.1 hypothetical protein HUW46_06453 [Amycolatopsis sp. CA-230715]
MPDHEAPRVFVTYADDSPEHQELVLRFAGFLRTRMGLDVELDQWYRNKRRDWSVWAIEHLTEAEFVLVIASPEYRRRADGSTGPLEGRGSHLEAAMLRDDLTKDLRGATERILPVVLPGQNANGIPRFLNAHSTTRFHVDTFSEAGVAELMAAITGRGRHPLPERGPWPAAHPDEPTSQQASRVTGLRWLASSAQIRPGSARIDGVHYADSILVRPTGMVEAVSFVEIDLGAAYRRLTAVVGILDDAIEPFQVGRFRVSLDGRPRSEHLAALRKPDAVDLDVTGALMLRLEASRPGVTTSSTHSKPPNSGLRSGRLPELAWGNPTLS